MPYRVGVVGYGMIGGLTSYLLAGQGHAVSLFERAPEVLPVGAGVVLQPSGQQVLAKLGVLDAVLAHAAPLTALHAVHLSGRTLIRNEYRNFDPAARGYGVHRGILFDTAKRLVETRPVSTHLATDIVRREVEGNAVYLRSAAGERFGPFDFVVCGDGSRSVLRAALGKRCWHRPYKQGAIWVVAPGAPVSGKLLQVVRGNRQLCGVLPLGDGLCTLYWGADVADFPALRRRGPEPLKAEIRAFCPPAAELLDFVIDMEQFVFTPYRAVWMGRRFDRHSVFLGDAAHAMSPHLGQGINIAMLDAWHLAEAVRTTRTPLEAFRAWHRRQAAYLRYYAALTFLLSPFFQSEWGFLGWGRDVVLPLLPKLPFVKYQMALTMSGLKGGLLKGKREL